MMNFACALPSALVKQNGPRLGVRGSAIASKPSPRGGARRTPLPHGAPAENRGFGMTPMPATAGSPLLFAFCCFPLLPQLSRGGRGSKNGPEGPLLTA